MNVLIRTIKGDVWTLKCYGEPCYFLTNVWVKSGKAGKVASDFSNETWAIYAPVVPDGTPEDVIPTPTRVRGHAYQGQVSTWRKFKLWDKVPQLVGRASKTIGEYRVITLDDITGEIVSREPWTEVVMEEETPAESKITTPVKSKIPKAEKEKVDPLEAMFTRGF